MMENVMPPVVSLIIELTAFSVIGWFAYLISEERTRR
jgi:hypothetical protein